MVQVWAKEVRYDNTKVVYHKKGAIEIKVTPLSVAIAVGSAALIGLLIYKAVNRSK